MSDLEEQEIRNRALKTARERPCRVKRMARSSRRLESSVGGGPGSATKETGRINWTKIEKDKERHLLSHSLESQLQHFQYCGF